MKFSDENETTLKRLFQEINLSINEYLLIKNNPGMEAEATLIMDRIKLLNNKIRSFRNQNSILNRDQNLFELNEPGE